MQITRKQVRYWLYRLANEEDGGAEANAPQEIIDFFSDKEVWALTGGWNHFAKTWDINDPAGERPEGALEAQAAKRVVQSLDNFDIIARDESISEVWNVHLNDNVKELPIKKVKKVKKADRPAFEENAEQNVTLKIE